MIPNFSCCVTRCSCGGRRHFCLHSRSQQRLSWSEIPHTPTHPSGDSCWQWSSLLTIFIAVAALMNTFSVFHCACLIGVRKYLRCYICQLSPVSCVCRTDNKAVFLCRSVTWWQGERKQVWTSAGSLSLKLNLTKGGRRDKRNGRKSGNPTTQRVRNVFILFSWWIQPRWLRKFSHLKRWRVCTFHHGDTSTVRDVSHCRIFKEFLYTFLYNMYLVTYK